MKTTLKLTTFWKKYSFVFYLILANAVFLPSVYLEIIKYFRAPPGVIYPLIHTDNPFDYNVYLSAITQGKFGSWLFRNHFTIEPQTPNVFYVLYLLIGKMAAIFHLWVPIAYHVAKFYIVEFFIIVSYFICAEIVGFSAGFWASLFAISATIAPISLFGEPGAYKTYLPWWNLMESFTRLDGIPHYIAGEALAITAILFVLFCAETKNWRFLIPAALFSHIAAIMLPTSAFPLLFGFPLACGILIIRSLCAGTYKRDIDWKFIGWLALMCVVIALTMGFEWLTTVKDTVWVNYKVWEVNNWNKDPHFVRSLGLAFGILPAMSIGGFLWSIHKGKWSNIVIAVWAILPFLLLPFINLIGMGKIRVTNEAPFVPLGILAAQSFFILKPTNKKTATVWTLGGILLFFLFTIPVTFQLYTIHLQSARTDPMWYNYYIPKGVFDAIDFTNASIPKDSIVFCDVTIGNMLPAYTRVKSFTGHLGQTIDYYIKTATSDWLLAGHMSEQDARVLLLKYHISYVYVDSLNNREKIASYSFLTPIYQNPDITIYRMQ